MLNPATHSCGVRRNEDGLRELVKQRRALKALEAESKWIRWYNRRERTRRPTRVSCMSDFALERALASLDPARPSRSAMAGNAARKGTDLRPRPMTGEPIETAQVAA